jgi:SP family general alpha glucoside:H+ symporter-like MFS transporter
MNIPCGIFTTVAISYADNVTPLALRGYLTSYINYCWLIGQLIGAGVLRSVEHITTEWGYCIPLGLRRMWQIPLITACIFSSGVTSLACKKTWNRRCHQEVKKAYQGFRQQHFDEQKTVAMMVHAHSLEQETDISLIWHYLKEQIEELYWVPL